MYDSVHRFSQAVDVLDAIGVVIMTSTSSSRL